MIPDWRELEDRLFNLASRAIEDFARAVPDEEFYGFYMDGNPETGQILLSLNSEEALRRQIVWYRTRWPDRYRAVDDALLADELRWNPGDWHYQDLSCEGWSKTTAALRVAIARRPGNGDRDQAENAGGLGLRLRETVRRVVGRLEQSHVFDQLKTTPSFRCIPGDWDDTDPEAADRPAGCQWLRQSLGNANPGRGV